VSLEPGTLEPNPWSFDASPCKSWAPIDPAKLVKAAATYSATGPGPFAYNWTAVTTQVDTATGAVSPVTVDGYRLYRAPDPNALQDSSKRTLVGGTTAATLALTTPLPLGVQYTGVLAFKGATEGTISSPLVVNVTAGTPTPNTPIQVPTAPTVQAPPAELALFTGSSTGTRPVYAKTAAGARGTKIGDLVVGPSTQTSPPTDRVKCSMADSLLSGSTRYYRVIDPRASAALRAGYASGCVSYGRQ
jgi:hypothetical protein